MWRWCREAAPVIALGADVVDLARFRLAVARAPGLVERIFTATEREVAAARRDPVPALAVRFAAKEAVMKVLGVGLGAVDWHDVEVRRQESGQPTLRITGRAATLADAAGVRAWTLSLSHSDLVALAVAAAE